MGTERPKWGNQLKWERPQWGNQLSGNGPNKLAGWSERERPTHVAALHVGVAGVAGGDRPERVAADDAPQCGRPRLDDDLERATADVLHACVP